MSESRIDPGSEEHYQRIRSNYVRLIENMDQIVSDIEWWNDNRLDAPPFDCEWAKLGAVRLRQALAAWDARDTVRASELMQEHIEAMEADGCTL